MAMYPAGPSRENPMQSWADQWSVPSGPFNGFSDPSSYPQPPPMPSDYQFGQRAWRSGSWRFAPRNGGGPFGGNQNEQGGRWRPFPGFGRPSRNPGSADYWATELKDNPLGLENMHIRADDQAKENEPPFQGVNEPQSQGSESLVWVPALQDNTNRIGRAPIRQEASRSSSQPPMARAQQAPGLAEYSEPPHTAHPQPREPTPTKPVYNTTGHSSHYNTHVAPCDVPQQQRTRPSSAAAHYHHYRPEPRRKSDEYIGYEGPRSGRSSVPVDRADRYPSYPGAFGLRNATMEGAQHHHHQNQTTVGGRSVQRSQTLPMNFSIPEDRQASGPYGSGVVHSTDSIDEYEEHKKELAKSKERVLKWLQQNGSVAGRAPPAKRQTADGYEHLRSPKGGQAARLSPSHGRQYFQSFAKDDASRRDALGRNHSLPAAFAPVSNNVAEMSDITEEPANMVSLTVDEGESSEEGMETDYDDGASERFRPVHRRQKTPLPTQRAQLERSDTLRVDEERSYQQTLPSPKSMRHPSSGQSSRIPSARSSYERVGEGGRVSTPNRHHLSPASSQQFQGATSYNTPPRTPNRLDYMYRQDDSRVPASASPVIRNSSHTAVASSPLRHIDRSVKTPSHLASSQQSPASFHTPPHLQYLYRSPATPSPQARPAAMGPATQGTQAQYGHGLTPGEKILLPRPSRSPSPRPPSNALQSGGHYAHGTPTKQIDQSQDNISNAGRSGHGHGHGRSPVVQRTPLTGRHVRVGFWNRRGDHLTQDKHVVSCPPGRNYPSDLVDYPDLGFQDHLGNRVSKMPDAFSELPDSIPEKGRPAKRPYETFINYVLI